MSNVKIAKIKVKNLNGPVLYTILAPLYNLYKTHKPIIINKPTIIPDNPLTLNRRYKNIIKGVRIKVGKALQVLITKESENVTFFFNTNPTKIFYLKQLIILIKTKE